MADDFTCILRDKFKRFMEELAYEELKQSIFTEELEVADWLLALSERICREGKTQIRGKSFLKGQVTDGLQVYCLI